VDGDLPPGNESRVWILKLNSNGALHWQYLMPGLDLITNHFTAITEVSTGGYLVASQPASRGIRLSKLDIGGSALWSKEVIGLTEGVLYSMIPSGDGSFLLAGYGTSTFENKNGRIMKVNESGQMIWSKQFGVGGGMDQFYSIAQTDDGHFIAAGYSESNAEGATNHNLYAKDAWLLKVKTGY